MSQIDKVARFVQTHPGFYVSHDERIVTIAVGVIERNGLAWTQYFTASTMKEARDVLGY